MYGVLLGIVAILLAIAASVHGSWFLILYWPATSFGIVAAGYLYFGARVFGKLPSGQMAVANRILLLPFLVGTWTVWYLLRVFQRERPYHQITETIIAGRRLFSSELPEGIIHIIDLTCEFSEPVMVRSRSYFSYPILDGLIPKRELMLKWIEQVANLSGKVYIHCAEGHGRTGMFTAILLVKTGRFRTSAEAVSFVQSKRPHVRLSRRQLEFVNDCVTSG